MCPPMCVCVRGAAAAGLIVLHGLMACSFLLPFFEASKFATVREQAEAEERLLQGRIPGFNERKNLCLSE